MFTGRTRFVPDPEFEEELKRARGTKEHVSKLAKDGAAIAERLAPRDTGALAGSIAEHTLELDAYDGFVGIIAAKDWKAHLLEMGTSRTRAQPFLRPALEELGLEPGEADDPGEVPGL